MTSLHDNANRSNRDNRGAFKGLLCDWLAGKRADLKLGAPELGDTMLALATVEGLSDAATQRILFFEEDDDRLIVRLHNVLQIGSEGHSRNRMADYTFRRLILGSVHDLDDDVLHMLGLTHDRALETPKDDDDMLMQLAFGSNYTFRRTSAEIHLASGQVRINGYCSCDFDCLPEDLDLQVRATLVHAQHLVTAAKVLKSYVIHSPTIDAKSVERVIESIGAADEADAGGDEGGSSANPITL